MKARRPADAVRLEQIPNVGPRIAADFVRIGIRKPAGLRGQDAFRLYERLCRVTRSYQDPCVLDTFMAAVHFMDGKGAKPWWAFTAGRMRTHRARLRQVKDRYTR